MLRGERQLFKCQDSETGFLESRNGTRCRNSVESSYLTVLKNVETSFFMCRVWFLLGVKYKV